MKTCKTCQQSNENHFKHCSECGGIVFEAEPVQCVVNDYDFYQCGFNELGAESQRIANKTFPIPPLPEEQKPKPEATSNSLKLFCPCQRAVKTGQ